MHITRIAITAAAASVLAAGAILAPAEGQSGSRTIDVFQPFDGGRTAELDLGRKGFSAGDQFLTTGAPLLDGPKGARIGSADGMQTVIGRAGNGTVHTLGAIRLRGGHLQFAGVHRHADRPQSLPITGGTGEYAGARGVLTITEDTKAKAVRLRVTLLP